MRRDGDDPLHFRVAAQKRTISRGSGVRKTIFGSKFPHAVQIQNRTPRFRFATFDSTSLERTSSADMSSYAADVCSLRTLRVWHKRLGSLRRSTLLSSPRRPPRAFELEVLGSGPEGRPRSETGRSGGRWEASAKSTHGGTETSASRANTTLRATHGRRKNGESSTRISRVSSAGGSHRRAALAASSCQQASYREKCATWHHDLAERSEQRIAISICLAWRSVLRCLLTARLTTEGPSLRLSGRVDSLMLGPSVVNRAVRMLVGNVDSDATGRSSKCP